ncbi:flagellar biosynthetic protein FliO [Woeseia oceani]|uniref:Flagellar protein n=1 Tax=Woeseia oceani TaxID=1548547 RepID=A0A193LEV0_9GAMM|nr:flagellar biosynthetic protein FliO [Woeseia oceani]ANO51055.1 flagellar biosynthetic protein FliO [Woeseia oceani]
MIRVIHNTALIAVCSVLQTVPAVAATVPRAAPVGADDVLNMGTGLILVIGAILVTGWLYSRTRKMRGASGDLIRIVASQPLGTRERVLLLQVADKQLLVGMTSSQVQTLHVFDDPVAIAEVPANGFAERLRAAVKGQQK